MRIDPTTVFFHTIASMPLRVCLAWIVGTMGAFAPVLIGEGLGLDTFMGIGWLLLFFPFYLFLIAVFGGWWAFVALPLLIVFAWRLLLLLRDEGSAIDLYWWFMLAFLIGITASEDHWSYAALVAGVSMFFVVRYQRRLGLGTS